MLDSSTVVEAEAITRRVQELDAAAPRQHSLVIEEGVPPLEIETIERRLELESERPVPGRD